MPQLHGLQAYQMFNSLYLVTRWPMNNCTMKSLMCGNRIKLKIEFSSRAVELQPPLRLALSIDSRSYGMAFVWETLDFLAHSYGRVILRRTVTVEF